MSGRRGGNRIRGPQSALTDFLAANNISAAQIRDDYERRRREADQIEDGEAGPSNEQLDADDDEAIAAAVAADLADEPVDDFSKGKKRKRNTEDAVEKVKKAKASKKDAKDKKGKKKKGKKGASDDEDDDDYEDLGAEMYKKSRPLPGQFEHCEVCSKRFTVTPYSKEGPEGGLLCNPCGKDIAKDSVADKKRAAPKAQGRKRRKLESDKLDGIAIGGAKTLQQLCIEKIAQHHDDVEELGDMPQPMVEKLSMIFSKKRVLTPKTLPLFLRPDFESVVVHDAAYLAPDDYQRIFAEVPKMQRLVLGNACQVKDEAIDYLLERCHNLRHVQLYAANLVSNEGWERLFTGVGETLEALKLKWLDASFEDETVACMVEKVPRLQRLKLKLCRRIGEQSVVSISKLQHLEHLSLQVNGEVSSETLEKLLNQRGGQLRTLSLERFQDADDKVLAAIKTNCRRISKLRFSENDTALDAAYVDLFTSWANPPLTFADLNSTRDVDNNNPDGPLDVPVGLGSNGFKALMAHSGSRLRHLNIASCRHISLSAFCDVFNPSNLFPDLEYINVSFCQSVDTTVIAGIFKTCPKLRQLVSFGCFDVGSVVVPRDVALIGVPKAQDAIEQFGVGVGVDEALGMMVDVGA
ncbi:RNI-like protein [Polychaeton citri CBS 116435]|uniref:RNI-like protein n=1 Tax=Polychaeton citri CBS 116435 TaxID=1314669 RepID=A0A9P4Q1A1_9PEZI|nr:RNI-like protein [Polychaeton citri CBS 116435]